MNKLSFDCLDPNGINNAIKQVESMKEKFSSSKVHEFLEALGKEGVAYATSQFQSAQYDGVNDVLVDMAEDGATVTLMATGSTVLFIEYGTGVYYADDAAVRAALVSGDVVGRGEYGKRMGRRSTWVYFDESGSKIFTHGNPSNGCMYHTQTYLEGKIKSIAKEVFG